MNGFILSKTKYYHFAKLNPGFADEETLYRLAKDKKCFITYYIDWINEEDLLFEGVIVFHRPFGIWNACKRLPNFNVNKTNDFDADHARIIRGQNVRTFNWHPLRSVRVQLLTEDDDITDITQATEDTHIVDNVEW